MKKFSMYAILLAFLACDYRVQVGDPVRVTEEDASLPVAPQSDAGTPDASTPTPECDLSKVRTGNDGCPKNALCEEEKTDGGIRIYCRTFKPCPNIADCPQYTFGSICNEDYIPNKDKICLDTRCKSSSNCPGMFACFKWNRADVLGVCSDESPGSPCLKSTHCESGVCLDAGSGRGQCQ